MMRNNKHKQPAQSKQNAWQVTGGTQNGDPTVANAGLIALYESWAEHIGKSYAHKTYGGNTSIPNYLNYQVFLENQRNEELNHIPIGFYYDLIDGININETASDGFWANGAQGNIIDNVSGLTNSQLFSLLNSSTSSPQQYITNLINSGFITGSNTIQGVNDLYNSY